MLFNEARTWRGQWWLPGRDELRAGVLSYDPEGGGLRLELVGGLSAHVREQVGPRVTNVVPDDGFFAVVLGAVNGRAVTLQECQVVHARGRTAMFGGSDQGEQDLSVGAALFGIHLQAPDDPMFDLVETSFQGLTAWAGLSAITVTSSAARPSAIGVQFPEDQVANVGQDVYRIVHWATGFNPTRQGNGTSISVRHEALLNVEPAAPSAWSTLRAKAGHVIELVSLARRSRPGLLSFRVRQAGARSPEGHPEAGWVDVLWKQRTAGARDERVAFTAEERGFAETLSHWLVKRDELKNAVNLVQAVWDDGWYLESAVLVLATATESLGSTLELPRKMDEKEYAAMAAAMLATAPPAQQAWLRSVLGQHLNGPSLKQKALAIADLLPTEVQDRLLPSVKKWAQVLVRERNNLSHSGSTSTDWQVLASLRQVTSAVIYLALLVQIGVPGHRIEEVLESDPYLRYACERSARDLAGS